MPCKVFADEWVGIKGDLAGFGEGGEAVGFAWRETELDEVGFVQAVEDSVPGVVI